MSSVIRTSRSFDCTPVLPPSSGRPGDPGGRGSADVVGAQEEDCSGHRTGGGDTCATEEVCAELRVSRVAQRAAQQMVCVCVCVCV